MEAQLEQQTQNLATAKARLASLIAYNTSLHQRIVSAKLSTSGRAPDAHMHGADSPSPYPDGFLKSFPIPAEASYFNVESFAAQLGATSTLSPTAAGEATLAEQTSAQDVSIHAVNIDLPRTSSHLSSSRAQRESRRGVYEPLESLFRPLSSLSYNVGFTYQNLRDAANACASAGPGTGTKGVHDGIEVDGLVVCSICWVSVHSFKSVRVVLNAEQRCKPSHDWEAYNT